jgi:hypothetical protein
MPIGGSATNGCDCPGISPVSGILIDGVIPSIDTAHGTWASELLTVNRNGRDSIEIGFQFESSSLFIRGIEIALFNCPVQGIGITGVNIYASQAFPLFFSGAIILKTTHNFTLRDNCQALSNISIPVHLSLVSFTSYFVEFLLTGGSSVNQLNWLYLGEISFSDETPPMIPITVIETTTPNEGDTLKCYTCSYFNH